MFRFFIGMFFCFMLLASNSGCAPIIIPAGVATTGVVVSQERSVSDNIKDTAILTRIKSYYASHDISNILMKVNVNVFEGRVMLIGSVTSNIYAEKAEKLVWRINGVKEVINEIIVEPEGTAQNSGDDRWIGIEIETKLSIEKSIQSTNYIVKVNKKVVYLLGVAKDEQELDLVLHIVSRVHGVEKVVNHVVLKSDLRRSTKK